MAPVGSEGPWSKVPVKSWTLDAAYDTDEVVGTLDFRQTKAATVAFTMDASPILEAFAAYVLAVTRMAAASQRFHDAYRDSVERHMFRVLAVASFAVAAIVLVVAIVTGIRL